MEIGGTSWLEQASDQRGSVFIAGLVMATVLTMLGGALFSFALSDTYLTSGTMNDARALYAAEIGLNQALLAYATGARVWPTTADTSFTDKPLTYGSQAARFTVTATPVNPTTLLVVSTGCYPKSAGGSCPDRSGFAKIQDTVQKQDTTATSNVGFPYVLAGGTGQVGGQSAAVNGDVYFNGDISQLNGTVSGKATSAQGSIMGGGQSDVRGNATAAGSITTLKHPVSGINIPNTPSSPITLTPVPSCGPPYSTYIPGVGPIDPSGDLIISGSATITEATAPYCLHSLTVTGQLQVAAGISVQLVVDGVTTITGGVVNTQHKAVNLQVYSSYGYDQATSASTGVATCAAVDPGLAFQMQGGGNPKGTADMLVYAPCADISITSDGTTLSGALVGRKVQASGHVTVTYDSSLNGGGFLYQPKGPVPVTQYSMGSLSWCQYRTRASTGCD